MCGIVGAYNNISKPIVLKMLSKIIHRGPDGTNFFINKKCLLGINRLAILDLKYGNQPMSISENKIHLVFNGEIFNYIELKNDLIKKGCKFLTENSDTEVIIHAYKIYGLSFVKKLNGMFAIAIYDENKNSLFLFRDRSGVKPLFYTKSNGSFYFASEIKSLLSIPSISIQPNKNAIYNYFSLKNIPSPDTAFKNIFQLKPGEFCIISDNNFQIKKYWDLPKVSYVIKTNDIKKKILGCLESSVKKQLRADVDVGCFLSGGLDSSAIAILASKFNKKKLKTFSMVYDKKILRKNLDNYWSKKISKKIKSDHYEYKLNEININNDIDDALSCFDQPFAGTISSYYLSKLASKHVKTALTGDGADELFGSYIFPRISEFKSLINTKYEKKFLKKSSDIRNEFIDFEKVKKLDLYEIKDNLMNLGENEKKKYLNLKIFRGIKKNNLEYLKEICKKFYDKNDLINSALKIDFKTLLADQVLSYVDILSMKSSLEIRPPFLDNEMIDLAFSINGNKKIKFSEPKVILKQSLKKILPLEILNRKKEGFVLPIEEMYIKKNLKKIKHTLDQKNLDKHGYLNNDLLNNLIKNINTNNFYDNNKIWIFYCFQKWWDKHF